ncbi:TIGR04283 family arsenosugar biosynthesis glycosyltransferase [Xanthomarina sp. F2636L]|uniref:TIGR04283 family arsenosugar biosynthesis glycosyltransferase n=1 Tax=Xanthomarina sp. F2636L TaxID=2996018 RepID=UPI00225DF2FC|nr:TIGR04283 family arsenosugar biosynthesis glycosyltransferase [Xanthomarina sp. F2636L]MCX7550905.1 TIGR04283 family arsenosugar biosynthesis glycosyltransferase [Xanthomarina sp. F2636L]
MSKHQISIIIPMLNEAENIKNLLRHLTQNSHLENISEIIVVDGGSTDSSQNIVETIISSKATKHNLQLLNSQKGRARQMNLGAKNASGDILYFLHADSFPPKNFDKLIIQQVQESHLAGCFKMTFNSNHWWLKLASWLTQFSWRACRGGDQSQFITKRLFNEIGGFNEEFIIYEDNDLINKLYAKKQFVVIQEWLTTSDRRYKTHGIWKLQYHFWAIYIKKWFGASAQELHSYYKKHIA